MGTGEELDVVVIGAGVVGLAIARALALSGREVVVVEAESSVGLHTSSRNSEVIHAGIYYPTGSSKARLCVSGRDALYAYCESERVPHLRCGKIIVATREEELPALEKIRLQAEANGVALSYLEAGDVHRLEPAVVALRALLSPATGIVDSHALMTAFLRDAERAGAELVLSTPVVGGEIDDGARITLSIGGAEPAEVRCRTVVNSAGLGAQAVARSLRGFPGRTIPPCHYAKGHYFVLAGKSPFSRLVYPIPEPGGLGVHVTLDLAGQARFGPDVSWVDAVEYGFDEARGTAFYAAIRRYYPALADGALIPGYTGIRPKLGPEGSASDFLIQGADTHGVPGLVNLYGIESPGLTASLAIANEVVHLAASTRP